MQQKEGEDIAAKTYTGKKKKVYDTTVRSMQELGVFKQEFDPTVQRYAELRVQFEILNKQFVDGGCIITEEYTNKAGATNVRKTALYLALETLRKELADLENILGLTPKGLKAIKAKGLDGKKGSALDDALAKISGA